MRRMTPAGLKALLAKRTRPFKKAPSFKAFLRKEIRPNAKVLVIGPGTIRHDPSTHFISGLVARRGQLVVLDTPEKGQLDSHSAWGGIRQFRREWSRRSSRKLPALVAGDGSRQPMRHGSFDVVYDHHALLFVARAVPEFAPKEKVILEYLRVLRPGGKAIIALPSFCDKKIFWEFLNPLISSGQITVHFENAREGPYQVGGKKLSPWRQANGILVISRNKAAPVTARTSRSPSALSSASSAASRRRSSRGPSAYDAQST
jgi:SAM-dependent methyltransferase